MRRRGRRGIAAVTLVTALTVALGATTATATPGPPSWDEVDAARGDVEATEIAVARIEEAAVAAEQQYAAAARVALERGEEHQLASIALEEAERIATQLQTRRDTALARAAESGARAAQLAGQLARSGAGDLATAFMVSGDDADGLLYRLGAMSSVSARSQAVLAEALQHKNTAESLTAQADVALTEREALAAGAAQALESAQEAAGAAEEHLATQEAMMGDLSARLATLTGRSAELERAYLAGLGGAESAPSNPAPSNPAPSSPAPSPPPPSSPAPSTPAPTPSAPAPSTAPPAPSPPPATSPPPPNGSAVSTAIAYARAQLGEPYLFGGRGPDAWDCSGLTMQAYAAAGVYIGGHSVSMQYNRAAQRDRLLPYSQAQPGDLIFYSYGGSTSGSKYHVTMYIGNGQMIEAPSPGKTVRIVTVRNYDRLPVVARPTP